MMEDTKPIESLNKGDQRKQLRYKINKNKLADQETFNTLEQSRFDQGRDIE